MVLLRRLADPGPFAGCCHQPDPAARSGSARGGLEVAFSIVDRVGAVVKVGDLPGSRRLAIAVAMVRHGLDRRAIAGAGLARRNVP